MNRRQLGSDSLFCAVSETAGSNREGAPRTPSLVGRPFARSSGRLCANRSDLALIGFVQPWGAAMASAEAQSKLLADYIRGAYRLLDRAAMKHLIRDVQRGMERRYVASKRHTIQVVMRSMSASFARNSADNPRGAK